MGARRFFMPSNNPEQPRDEKLVIPKAELTGINKHAVPRCAETVLNTIIPANSKARPILMVGEGSHRSHEFFKVQATVAQQAIERGCRQLCMEVPALFVVELKQVMARGPQDMAEAVRGYIKENPYLTWNDESIVKLLIYIGKHNQSASGAEKIGITGLDPQADNAEARLENIPPVLLDSAAEGSWVKTKELYGAFRDTFNQWNNCYSEPLGAKKEELGNECTMHIETLLKYGEGLDPPVIELLQIMLGHLRVRNVNDANEGMRRRDEEMANRVVNAFNAAPKPSRSDAPRVVVLAHNCHVSLAPRYDIPKPSHAASFAHDQGPTANTSRRFSDGMGYVVSETLSDKALFPEGTCTVVLQTSKKTALATSKEEGSLTGLSASPKCVPGAPFNAHEHLPLQKYELESIVEVHVGPLVVVDLHCAAQDTTTELNRNRTKEINGFKGTVTFRSYGGRAPWKDQLPQSNMFPEEHGHFAVVHEETTPALRVLKERSSSAS
jgi:Erythromycin esterase